MLRALDEALAALVPPACVACRAPLRRAGEVLCGACRGALPWLLDGPRCRRCALPVRAGRCRRCPLRGSGVDAVWTPVAHDGAARALVAALKFHGRTAAAGAMAAAIVANAPPGFLTGDALLVPVPGHPARRRRRGFDQGRLLADAVARRSPGLGVARPLRRAGGRGPSQRGAGRAERLAGARVRVRTRGPSPPVVVLVDDVVTTGGTLAACAAALRQAGAREVRAVAYARAL